MVAPATTPQDWTFIVPRRRNGSDDIGPLARLLRRLRAERGVAQTAVAKRAGWEGNSYYSALETGAIRAPGKDKVRDLERAFEVTEGEIERVVPRRDFAINDEAATYDVLGGVGMEIKVFSDEIVIRNPDPSTRRIVEHVGVLSDRARLSVERSLLDLREQEADIDGEEAAEAAQADRRTGTKEAT